MSAVTSWVLNRGVGQEKTLATFDIGLQIGVGRVDSRVDHANFDARALRMGPDFREVDRVDAVSRFLRRYGFGRTLLAVLSGELTVVGKPRLIGTVIDSETTKPIEKFKVRVEKLKTHRGPNYGQNNQWTSSRNEKGTFEENVGVFRKDARALYEREQDIGKLQGLLETYTEKTF